MLLTLNNSIYLTDNSNRWAVGDGGVIIHTTDGINWNGQINPDSQVRSLYDVFFLNAQEGWAVGYNGILLHTTDGGGTLDGHWQVEGTGVAAGRFLSAVFAVDNHTLYVVGNNTFLKYTQVTGVGEKPPLPSSFALYQNYPNPFNPSTEIRYQTSEVSHVTLKVYDLLGREVATLVDEVKEPGEYQVQFDGSNLASGIYLYRLQSPSGSLVRKMILIR
jgi:hypothetical protein